MGGMENSGWRFRTPVFYLVPPLPSTCFVQVTVSAPVSSLIKFRSWSKLYLWFFPLEKFKSSYL